mgnify:CR=1 FL=1
MLAHTGKGKELDDDEERRGSDVDGNRLPRASSQASTARPMARPLRS